MSNYYIRVSAGVLDAHLERNVVEYLQFSFRWMNNLLMREMPLRCTIRLWDTYLVSVHLISLCLDRHYLDAGGLSVYTG